MGFSLTLPAPEKCDPTAKNRVWGFFGETQQSHRENRPQSLQPRQGDRPSLTKTVSGRTYWPSRDPIGERGGENLYGMVNNNPINNSDLLGNSVNLVNKVEFEGNDKFDYQFQVQYDFTNELTKRGINKAQWSNLLVLEKMKFEFTWCTLKDCENKTESFTYDEWFKLTGSGKTAVGPITSILKDKSKLSSKVDIQAAFHSDVCHGSVKVSVDYGISTEVFRNKNLLFGLGEFGISGVDTHSGNSTGFSSNWTHKKGFEKLAALKIDQFPKKWSYRYDFKKEGKCCENSDPALDKVSGWSGIMKGGKKIEN